MLKLREHQEDGVEKLRENFKRGIKRQIFYAATGYGKTELAIFLMDAVRKNYKRVAFVCDRLVLVNQTSARLTKYGIPHGVLQAKHEKYDLNERIQVVSAQTMEKRPEVKDAFELFIIDEAHQLRRKTVEFIKKNPDMKVIGLTATPFTAGLGEVYQTVVSNRTTSWLVEQKWLCPLRVYISKEIDMEGAKTVAGEWSSAEVAERGIKITGDIVAEWESKTMAIFGKPEKTVVFCAGVAHGQELVREFARKGYNFVSLSYLDEDNFKKEVVSEFEKPDSTIHGLIATDILTKGFDCPAVKIGVSARPFKKSLSSHIQQMGRVMRSHPDKSFGLWLCHSGNYIRFQEDWDNVYEQGVTSLEHLDKAHKEPTKKKKSDSKCPKCGFLWKRGAISCTACGFTKERTSGVIVKAGKMEQFSAEAMRSDPMQKFYSELIAYGMLKGFKPGWASNQFKQKYGKWPNNLISKPADHISLGTKKWIMSRNIAYAKAMNRNPMKL